MTCLQNNIQTNVLSDHTPISTTVEHSTTRGKKDHILEQIIIRTHTRFSLLATGTAVGRVSQHSSTMPIGIRRLNAQRSHPNDRIVFIKPLPGPSESVALDFLERIAAQCCRFARPKIVARAAD